MIEPGTLLLGKYRIDRVIGEGGMGVVALAHHVQLDQPVAIKFLLPQVLDNPDVVQRFLREAQAAVKLRSEHVARVSDVGTLETGAPYMVMEFLDGMDLGELLTQQGALVPGLAVDFMLQACEALAEAHALGIVHRDIKPANFFITSRASGAPLLKVLDFGISKSAVTVDEGLTSTQAIMGTPAYMSPEQMRSTKHVDARADIWAVGVVLHESLSGRRPFSGETFSALCLQVAMDPPEPLTMPLPPGLADVVARCMEKDPDARFQNVAELAAALAPFARTPGQAASSTERTAGVLGLLAGPPQTLPSGSHRAPSHMGTGPAPSNMGTGPAPSNMGTGRAPSNMGTGAAGAAPTTMGSSSGELAGASGRRPHLGLILAAAGALAACVALVLVLTAGSGKEPGPAAPVPAAMAPAATTTEGGEQPAGAAAAPGEATAAADTEIDAGLAAATPEADEAAPATAAADEEALDEAEDDDESRRDRRDRRRRTDSRSARRDRDEASRTRRESSRSQEKQKRTKGGDTDDLFGSRQ